MSVFFLRTGLLLILSKEDGRMRAFMSLDEAPYIYMFKKQWKNKTWRLYQLRLTGINLK